jgi:CBS-domain-containing membrane protein
MPSRTPARRLHARHRIVRRGVYLLDRNFLRRPKRYVLQSVLATLTIAAVIAVQDSVSNVALTSAMAASAFIVFQMPHSRFARPRRVIGGHLVAVIVGLAAAFVAHSVLSQGSDSGLATDMTAAVALGTTLLAMAMTDTEHPPGAATVVGVVFSPNPLESGLLILGGALALSAIHHRTKNWLINLAH